MSEKSMIEACDEISQMILDEEYKMTSPGIPIQEFIDYLNAGETPAMAAAMVKTKRDTADMMDGIYE